jgi:hypothetical protein
MWPTWYTGDHRLHYFLKLGSATLAALCFEASRKYCLMLPVAAQFPDQTPLFFGRSAARWKAGRRVAPPVLCLKAEVREVRRLFLRNGIQCWGAAMFQKGIAPEANDPIKVISGKPSDAVACND